MAVEARHADADGVLGAGYFGAAGFVFEAEEDFSQLFGVVEGKLVGPEFAGGVAGGGGHAAAFHELDSGFDGDGEGPAWAEFVDVGLVDPGAGQVEAEGQLALGFAGAESSGGAGWQAGFGDAFQDEVMDAEFGAELIFGWGMAVFVDNKDIGAEFAEINLEIEDAGAFVDPGVGDVAAGFDHVEAFLFGINGISAFQVANGGIGAEADVEVAVGGGFLEKGNVAAVEHVVTT